MNVKQPHDFYEHQQPHMMGSYFKSTHYKIICTGKILKLNVYQKIKTICKTE